MYSHVTSHLNGKITVSHRSAIIVNHYFSLNEALLFLMSISLNRANTLTNFGPILS
jgi:hypothetical protein